MNPDPQNRSPWRWHVFAAFVCLLAPPTVQSAELGRLFYTPQQRQQMQYQISTGSSDEEETKRNYIIVNGVVQKQGGKRTVWVNGTEKAAGQSNNQTPSVVPVDVPGKSRPVYLKVGDKLLLDTPAQEENQ